jgi:putative hydrolase of HD superfamily
MNNPNENIINFYKKANRNKNEFLLFNEERDYSVAEVTVLSCIDAISRYSELSKKNYDLNKVIRMIILSSVNGKIDSLTSKDKYGKIIDELNNENTLESKYARLSIYKVLSGYKEKNNVVNDLFNNYLKLQKTIRQGHIYWGVKGRRLESILEHIYGTLIIILGIESEYNYHINYDKILTMLILHETEEIKIGDITEWDGVSKGEKIKLGKKAVKDILGKLKDGKMYIDLLDEFNSHLTLDSSYAHLSDKLEYDLQVKMYELDRRYDFENRPSNVVTESSSVKDIIDNGASSVFDVHYEYDKDRYNNIPCMRGILELAKKM